MSTPTSKGEEKIKKYVSKRLDFAYPDKNGNTEMIGCTLIVEEKESDNFDKFWNMLRSLTKALGIKELKIYDYGK